MTCCTHTPGAHLYYCICTPISMSQCHLDERRRPLCLCLRLVVRHHKPPGGWEAAAWRSRAAPIHTYAGTAHVEAGARLRVHVNQWGMPDARARWGNRHGLLTGTACPLPRTACLPHALLLLPPPAIRACSLLLSPPQLALQCWPLLPPLLLPPPPMSSRCHVPGRMGGCHGARTVNRMRRG
jgi:hypothetical protein